jgi:hypothetical protein
VEEDCAVTIPALKAEVQSEKFEFETVNEVAPMSSAPPDLCTRRPENVLNATVADCILSPRTTPSKDSMSVKRDLSTLRFDPFAYIWVHTFSAEEHPPNNESETFNVKDVD